LPVTVEETAALRAVVHRACQRAGLPQFGAHRLLHAVACDLLRHGASLAEAGQLLRHRDERTTAIYANSQKLHQPGEEPQVSRRQDRLNSTWPVLITAL
jgi:integrase